MPWLRELLTISATLGSTCIQHEYQFTSCISMKDVIKVQQLDAQFK